MYPDNTKAHICDLLAEVPGRNSGIAFLMQDGNLRVPCSRYGYDTATCAEVAYDAALIMQDATGDPMTYADLESDMGMVVNDSDSIARLFADHGRHVLGDRWSEYEGEDWTYWCDYCDEETGPCDGHAEAVVIRQGASTRTGDDWLMTFLHDCLDLGLAEGEEDKAERCRLQDALEANRSAIGGTAWLEDPDDSQSLYDMAMGYRDALCEDPQYWVNFEDGYVIWVMHPDCPLKHQ